MMELKDILYKVKIRSIAGNREAMVKAIQIDSRKVAAEACFIAIKGATADGHLYIDAAIKAGASVVVVASMPEQRAEHVTYVEVENTQEAAAYMAHSFYGEPSDQIKLVGVTGTNGKTTVATLLFQLFTELGYMCGLISTVNNQIGATIIPATHTTPDAIQLNALLREMVHAGCSYVFMECSSHAIHQHRISALNFTGALFTNITHDHLDYHQTFDEYIRVKKQFFDQLPSSAFALTNLDDKRGAVMLQNTQAKKIQYSLKSLAAYKGRILENGLTGLVMQVNEIDVHFRMIGAFNAYNLLCVYGAAMELGGSKDEVLLVLSKLKGAPGRFDYQISAKNNIIAIVDYAHTPDAIVNVLETIHQLRENGGKIITVVGCGGDRDKTKRPLMAKAACDYSDKVLLTADNPRTEDPLNILKDMEQGLDAAAKRKYVVIPDRREAIKMAVTLAAQDDIILVAGKGHENYQDIGGVKHDFDDKKVLVEMFELLDK